MRASDTEHQRCRRQPAAVERKCRDASGDHSNGSSAHVPSRTRDHVGADTGSDRSCRKSIPCREVLHRGPVLDASCIGRRYGLLQASGLSHSVARTDVKASTATSCSRGAASSRLSTILLTLVVLLLCLNEATGLQPLLGASLSWQVSRRFRTGDRLVNITLHSAFATADDCTYTIGSPVQCRSKISALALPNSTNGTNFTNTSSSRTASDTCAICEVAKHHGVLCIGQLIRHNGGLALLYSNSAGSCVNDAHPFASVSKRANNSDDTRVSLSHIGKVNDFVVESTYLTSTEGQKSEARREHAHDRTNGLSTVVGTLAHQVRAADDAVAVVAWLQREDRAAGTCSSQVCRLDIADGNAPGMAANCDCNGMSRTTILLPACEERGQGVTACSVNTDPRHNVTWAYWSGLKANVEGLPDQILLQTYIPLCSKTRNSTWENHSLPGDTSCSVSELNHHSPEPSFPFLIQVASPRGSPTGDFSKDTFLSSSGGVKGGSDGLISYKAPHAPMYYRAYDGDGDVMMEVVVSLTSSSSYAQREYGLRCFLGGADGAMLKPNEWPSRQCMAGRRKGFACIDKTDCPSIESPSRLSARFDASQNASFSESCTETWSTCREYVDAASTFISGNLIKFDFDFTPEHLRRGATSSLCNATCWDNCLIGCQNMSYFNAHAHCMYQCIHGASAPGPFLVTDDACVSSNLSACNTSRVAHFTQHLIVTLDSNYALEASLSNTTPTWNSSPRSSASPLLFSAFPCDPGTSNQPPVFVTGLKSFDTRVRAEYTCVFGEECEVPLFARDMTLDSEPRDSADEIAIEAAVGFEQLGAQSLFRPDGSECRGSGPLFCIYKLALPDDGDVMSWPTSVIRCFTAFDIHDSDAAPGKRSCRSLPFCIKVRFSPLPSWRALYHGIGVIKAFLQLDPRDQQSFRGAHIYLRWNDTELAPVTSNLTASLRNREVVLQFTNRRVNLEELYVDISPEYVTVNTTSEAYIVIRDLLALSSCTLTECEFNFRFKFRVESPVASRHTLGDAQETRYEMVHGPASNGLVIVLAAQAPDKALIAGEWKSQVLRVWDVDEARAGERLSAQFCLCVRMCVRVCVERFLSLQMGGSKRVWFWCFFYRECGV